ncbi:MAG: S1 RNA-binding domain-containing protein [bacterium]
MDNNETKIVDDVIEINNLETSEITSEGTDSDTIIAVPTIEEQDSVEINVETETVEMPITVETETEKMPVTVENDTVEIPITVETELVETPINVETETVETKTVETELVETPINVETETVESQVAVETKSDLADEKINEVYNYLKNIKETGGFIEADIIAKIRGGFRVLYQDIPMFLPTSHFGFKRSPSDEDLNKAVGSKIQVAILEMQEDETKRKTVVVTRRPIIESEFWSNIKRGDKVTGTVSAITTFGVFLDLGPVEGLIHISRLSNTRVVNIKDYAKIGDKLEAVVIECDKDSKKISLSRKEQSQSSWTDKSFEFTEGQKIKGIVRRLADFGAFVEVAPGIDGLLRNQEISWEKRVSKPNELINVGDELELLVLSVDLKNMQIALSLKQLQENPWEKYAEKYHPDMEIEGLVKQVFPQGAIVSIDNEIDGFIPRSRIKNIPHGKRLPFQIGDKISVIIEEVNKETGTMILSPKQNEAPAPRQQFDSNRPKPQRKPKEEQVKLPTGSSSFSFADLLSDAAIKNLMDNE